MAESTLSASEGEADDTSQGGNTPTSSEGATSGGATSEGATSVGATSVGATNDNSTPAVVTSDPSSGFDSDDLPSTTMVPSGETSASGDEATTMDATDEGPPPEYDCEGEVVIEDFGDPDFEYYWNGWSPTSGPSYEINSAGNLRFLIPANTEPSDAGIETLEANVNIVRGFAQVELDDFAPADPSTRFYFKLSGEPPPCEDNLWIEGGNAHWRDRQRRFDPQFRFLRWRGDNTEMLHLEGSPDGVSWTNIFTQPSACDLTAVKLHVYAGSTVSLDTASFIDVASIIYCR